MNKKWKLQGNSGKLLIIGSIIGGLFAGCGDSGGGASNNNNQGTTTLISGTAAAGAAVSKGMGYALDASTGNQISFVTGTDGAYSVNLTGKTGPFLIRVRGLTSGGTMVDLYSLASTANFGGTVNVTPLSDVVVGYAAGKRTDELEAACLANLAGCPAMLNGIVANLALSSSKIVQALPASVLSAFTVDQATFDAITTPFTADHSGADGLLDALQVVPPAAGMTNGSYTINLTGATATPLVTVPVSTAAATTAPTTDPTAPTPAQVSQAVNLAAALAETQTFIASLNGLFATALPTNAQLTPYFDVNYLHNGENRATAVSTMFTGQNALPVGSQFISGGLSPYSGAPLGGAQTPGANVSYDANNCVTSMWVNFGINGLVRDNVLLKDAIPAGNATGVCTGGTWTIAGNQRRYTSRITSLFMKLNIGQTPIYRIGFNLDTETAETTTNPSATAPYSYATVSGPGITTLSNKAGTNGTVVLVAGGGKPIKTTNPISDPVYGGTTANNPYYPGKLEGSNQLRACTELNIGVGDGNWNSTPTASTPCLNMAAVAAGLDYTIKFYDAANTLLETDMQRLDVAPTTIPESWYPTINTVTPAGPTMTAAGGTVTATWTLPSGALANLLSLNINDKYITTLMNVDTRVAPAATSGTVTVPAWSVTPFTEADGVTYHSGLPGLGVDGISSSYAFVITAVGGVIVATAQPY